MSAQLGLWSREETPLSSDPELTLSIRESRRARQLILQALPPRTIEIVVPAGTRSATVRHFIESHRSWIERAGAEMVATYPDTDLLPDTIDLHAVGRCLRVRYLESVGDRRRVVEQGNELHLSGSTLDSDQLRRSLRRWLLETGRRVLRPWLAAEAERTGLRPARVQVRLQKTRWGSCSGRGSISLNAALLLVQPELVRYLLVHELCHLTHLSHSRRYWALVARHEPDYRALDSRLAASWRDLPAWLYTLTRGEVT